MRRALLVAAAGAAGLTAATALPALPAQAAWSTTTTHLTCTDPQSTHTVTMDVRLTAAGGAFSFISSTSYSTSPAFRAEEVRLMLRKLSVTPADTAFSTLQKWGDVATKDAVATSGTSSVSSWDGPPPIMERQVDELKLKVYDSGHYLDCATRKVGWVP